MLLDTTGGSCLIYANFKARRDGILDSGFLRFHGTIELHETGPARERIFSLLVPRERQAEAVSFHLSGQMKKNPRRERSAFPCIEPS